MGLVFMYSKIIKLEVGISSTLGLELKARISNTKIIFKSEVDMCARELS